jgi:hypothetical protein
MFKTNTKWLMLALLGLISPNSFARSDGHHSNQQHSQTKTAAEAAVAANGLLTCRVVISPKEEREIIILKMQQRMDCLEVKLNETSQQLNMLRQR